MKLDGCGLLVSVMMPMMLWGPVLVTNAPMHRSALMVPLKEALFSIATSNGDVV
jgi:hypothetical protein